MSYYVCKGKVNRFSTISKPIYRGNHFADFFEFWVGYAKDPSELNLSFPFPQEFTDSEGRIWLLTEGTKPDNHQFLRKREIQAKNHLQWKPRNKEKYQDPTPAWNSQAAQTPSLWKFLKGNKLYEN